MFANTKIIVEIKAIMQNKRDQLVCIGWFVEFENGESAEYLISFDQHSNESASRYIMLMLLKHYPRERIEKIIRAWRPRSDIDEYFRFAFANEVSWKENCELLFECGVKPTTSFIPADAHIDYYLTRLHSKEYESVVRVLKDIRAKDAKIAELTGELANLRVQVNKIVSDTPAAN